MSMMENQQFNNLVQTVSVDMQYKKIIASAQKIYMTKQLGLQTLNPSLVVQLINRNFEKTAVLKTSFEEQSYCSNELIWALNEFKLFAWISVCYGFAKNKVFQTFNIEDYQFLQSLFARKSLQFLQYHLKSLVKEFKNIKEIWSAEEVDLLTEIIQSERFNYKWSEISFKLFLHSQKRFFRTPQKCREKWFNHLAPQVNRAKWTSEEDLELFNYIIKYGAKWALVSKLFNGSRTEHMIKNRYNSLIKKFQSKSQRTSAKKLIDRIHIFLENKVASQEKFVEVKLENESESENENEMSEITEKSIKVASRLTEIETNEVGSKDMSEVEEAQVWKPLRTIKSFDFEDILFSQNTIEIKQTQNDMRVVELIEVEILTNSPPYDQYLSSLLF